IRHDAVKFLGQEADTPLLVGDGQSTVVPESPVSATVEAFPERLTERTVVRQDRAGVVQLVGRRHPQDFRGSRALVGDVLLLPLSPGWLGYRLGVRAAFHDAGDVVTEAATDLFQPVAPSLILDGVVQEGSDCLVLAAAVLQDQRADGKEMADIRDGRALAELRPVHLSRVAQGTARTSSRHPPWLLRLGDAGAAPALTAR